MMVFALLATMCVGFTACSKDDDKPEEEDKGYVLMGTLWCNMKGEDDHFDTYYNIEFNREGTYSYRSSNESAAGNFKIFESQKSTGVLSYRWWGNENEVEWEYDFTLYKMNVIGSSNFDQLWVYYIDRERIIVHLYSNDELVQKEPMYWRYEIYG